MPRNVRNFWVEADIDGRSSKFAGGPGSASGGMQLRLFYRENGRVSGPLTVNCCCIDGKLFIDLDRPDGETTRLVEAER